MQYPIKWIIFLSVLVFLSKTSVAEPMTQSERLNFDNVTKDSLKINEQTVADRIKAEADLWTLNLSDYHRYQQLLQNPLVNTWWKELDPPHLLGLMANTPSEVQKYAEIEVQLDFNRTERELNFQEAYTQAFKKHYPQLKPIGLQESK